MHWELTNANPYNFQIQFAFRTRNTGAPLVFVRWNALRSFQIHLTNDGHLVVSPIGLSTNRNHESDWLTSRQPITDGHWHRIKFVLASTNMNLDDHYDRYFDNHLCKNKLFLYIWTLYVIIILNLALYFKLLFLFYVYVFEKNDFVLY